MSHLAKLNSPANLHGRHEMVDWVNSIVQLDYSHVDDCANGAAFCQILDATYPGSVPLWRVHFGATLQHQMFDNYKVLQECLAKNGIGKDTDVGALSAGRMKGTREVLQWLYAFYTSHAPHPPTTPRRAAGRKKTKDATAEPHSAAVRAAARGAPTAPRARRR
jgi:RP/EB family microtubule-associated protein